MPITVIQTHYGPKTILGNRFVLPISHFNEKGELFDETFGEIEEFIDRYNIERCGPSAFVYEQWDEEEDEAVVTIGVIINPATLLDVEINEFEVIDILECDAIIATVMGSYDQLADAHLELIQYIETQCIDKPVSHFIEEYDTIEEDERNNVTHVVYILVSDLQPQEQPIVERFDEL